jgi:RHS repeat-associated protein
VLAYTAKGKLASITRGTRKTAFTYNTKGFLATATDPLKLKTSLAYDADGNLLTATLPDGRIVSHTYDGNGNLLSVTPPGKSAHTFTYTEVDLPASYTPPGGASATTFAYDLDRHLTSMVRPGSQTVTYAYDTAGRLTKVVTPTATEAFTYSGTTGNIASAARGSEHVAYSYNGPLLTTSTWTGTVAGNIAHGFNNNFWVTSQTVNGGSRIVFKYDNDGLATGAGLLTVKRNPTSGLITGTTLGSVTDTRTYNSFGELTGYTASVNGTAAYKYQLTLNADGMITAKSETIGGVANTYSYTYDLTNRLVGASKNGGADSYTYDANSNRLSATTGSGTASASYDAQDRLLTYGATSFTYNLAGDTTSQKTGTQNTSYRYDALGNLTAVTLPTGTKLTYVIDGENNRVGKTVNGAYTTGFLFDDDRIVAQLNASNQLVSQFVYAAGLGSPDYMISGASTYRIVHDPVGSPVLVIDTATGTIVQQITYDEFGNVLSDTNPGFQPFGFAGGLYDQDTKLVRFGARDYNPAAGRWTAKDPTLLSGGGTNLYNYAQTDPVNHTDLTGLGDCKEGDKKTKAKKIVKKVVQKVTGNKLPVGPINISTDKPEMSIGASVPLKVDGQTVAEVSGEVAVGITPDPNPSGPLIYIDTDVAIKIGNWTIWENKTHTEALDTNGWRTVSDIKKNDDRAWKAQCETCSDGVQPATE